MANKRCFFVIGPEGSGTYMMAEALVVAGCGYIEEENYLKQALDECEADNIVVRRSLPHAGKWIELADVYRELAFASYLKAVEVIAIVRESNATIKSVCRRAKLPEPEARQRLTLAMDRIAAFCVPRKVTYITYEAVVGSHGFQEWLFKERLGLKIPAGYMFYDRNAKYYD